MVLGKIARGEFAPGERLPPQAQLRRELVPSLSMTDFNKGLKILKRERYLKIKPNSHTTVANPLPHRNDFALILRKEVLPEADTSLFAVMAKMAKRLEERHAGYKMTPYYLEPAAPDNGHSIDDLLEAARWHRVGGIVFPVQWFHSGFLVNEQGIAKVYNAEGLETRPSYAGDAPHFVLPEPGNGTFLDLALERIASMGCKTVAIIDPSVGEAPHTGPRIHTEPAKHIVKGLKKFGLETRPEWVLRVKAAGWEIGRLLMNLKERPDAVIIDDDGLVPAITAGIASMPKPWPVVVAVVNFPAIPKTEVPTIFAGFDIEALFEWCFDALRSPQIQSAKPAYPVKVLFEEEWRAAGGKPL